MTTDKQEDIVLETTSTKGTTGKEQSGARLAELSDRLAKVEKSYDDDWSSFLEQNWQRILGALGVLLIGVFLFTEFQRTQDVKSGEYSERVFAAADKLRELPPIVPPTQGSSSSIDPAVTAANVKSRAIGVAALRSVSTDAETSPYGRIAQLYLAREALDVRNFDEALKLLAGFDTNLFDGMTVPQKVRKVVVNQMVTELACLLKARVLLESGKQSPAKLREYLKELAYGADLVNAEALVLLIRTAGNDVERKATTEVIKKVVEQRPEIAEQVKPEAERFGLAIED